MNETAEEWIKCFPVNRRIAPDKLKKKFPALVKKYGFKALCDKTRTFAKSHEGTELKWIPHPMTWINRGGLDEEEIKEKTIENPHEHLNMYCDMISRSYVKNQRSKGNWLAKEINDGREVVDAWLKGSGLTGMQLLAKIKAIMEPMHSGTEVTSFTHWQDKLKG